MGKIVSDPRLPVVKDEKIRPLTQRLYELFRQYAIAHNKSYMWDTEGTSYPTTGTWAISQMCKNTSPSVSGPLVIGWICIASGTPGTWVAINAAGYGRELLTSDRTYYVRTDGSNSNNGLANTSGGAFLTIQKAIDVVCSLDMSIYQATIQIADGTYTDQLTLKQYVGALEPIIIGNTTTPSNCIINTTDTSCIMCGVPGASWTLQGLKLTVSGTALGDGVRIYNGARLRFGYVDFGTASGTYGAHIRAITGGIVYAIQNYNITGSAYAHAWTDYSGGVKVSDISSITLSGTPNFSGAFLFSRNGWFECANIFSGSATGVRYNLSLNAVAYFGGATLPGNSAGTTSTGGQYA